MVAPKNQKSVMITCEKQRLGGACICGAWLRVSRVINVSWKLEELNGEIQVTHMLMWVSC